MKILMIRTFHPVGQGAFYSEEFFDANGECVFRVVYDCGLLQYCKLQRNSDGSPLTRRDVEKRVTGAFSDDHGIDVLFISHLDDDHVNLIPCLEAFRQHKIRTVILPLLTDEERHVLTGYYLSCTRKESDVVQIINNPKEYFGGCVKVVFVRPFNDERPHAEDDWRNDRIVYLDDLKDLDEIPSLTKISIKTSFHVNGRMPWWLLIPYNHEPKRYYDLEDELENVFGKEFQTANLKEPDFVIKNLKGLRRCYRALQDGINRNSMALYSGPLDDTCLSSIGEVEGGDIWGRYCPCDQFAEFWFYRVLRDERSSTFHGSPGCLYTGDMSLDDVDLMRAFGRYVRNIGMVQLPHHGSLNSFGTGNLPIDGRVCVVTYGERNSFGHPAYVVKRAVAQKGGLWVDVTEAEESRFMVKFNVKWIGAIPR